jgi:hypothetical protein
MISIQNTEACLNAAVLGEFTLADLKDLEQQVLHRISFQGRANLIVDLRDMLGYTVDVAWEEIKFTRSHARDFGRIALVTDNQWVTWSAWLESLFTDADIETFADYDEAVAWVEAASAESGDTAATKP